MLRSNYRFLHKDLPYLRQELVRRFPLLQETRIRSLLRKVTAGQNEQASQASIERAWNYVQEDSNEKLAAIDALFEQMDREDRAHKEQEEAAGRAPDAVVSNCSGLTVDQAISILTEITDLNDKELEEYDTQLKNQFEEHMLSDLVKFPVIAGGGRSSSRRGPRAKRKPASSPARRSPKARKMVPTTDSPSQPAAKNRSLATSSSPGRRSPGRRSPGKRKEPVTDKFLPPSPPAAKRKRK